jgi:CheY-like chemotaxis protein
MPLDGAQRRYVASLASRKAKKVPRMVKKTILVVDDEEDILELVRFHLAREGYTVLSAETGEQAWRIAREQHVDLALVDLMLPGIDGLELTRRLKTMPRRPAYRL